MVAAEFDLTIEQGADYARTFACQTLAGAAVDLSAYASGLAQIRSSASSRGSPLAVFTVAITDPTNGQLSIALAAAVTSSLPEAGGYWDLFLTGDAGTIKLMRGRVNVVAAVSHD